MSHFHLHFIFLRYNISSPYWSLDGCEIRSMVAIAMDEKERTFLSGLWLFPLASWLLLILFSSSSKTKFKKFLVSTLFLFSIEKSIRISPTTTTAPCFLKIDTWCYRLRVFRSNLVPRAFNLLNNRFVIVQCPCSLPMSYSSYFRFKINNNP